MIRRFIVVISFIPLMLLFAISLLVFPIVAFFAYIIRGEYKGDNIFEEAIEWRCFFFFLNTQTRISDWANEVKNDKTKRKQ